MTHRKTRQHSGTSEPVKICPVHPTIASKKEAAFLRQRVSKFSGQKINIPANVGYTFGAGGIFSLSDFDIGKVLCLFLQGHNVILSIP